MSGRYGLSAGLVPTLTARTLAVLRVLASDRQAAWSVAALAERSGVVTATVRVVIWRLGEAGWAELIQDGDERRCRITGVGWAAAGRVLRPADRDGSA